MARSHDRTYTSVGIVGGEPLLDLCYEEDVTAGTDMNVVMTGEGAYVEVQGTARAHPSTASCSTNCSTSRRSGVQT